MTRVDEALALARARASAARARGGYEAPLDGFAVEPLDRVTLDQLLDWAVVEPDLDLVRSTRRFGAPVTFAKRLLARMLRQYNGQMLAQQQRLNIQLALTVDHLAERVKQLEERRD